MGFVNPKLYSIPSSAFRDITSGNNDDSNLGYYSAGTGWDACTGLGTPDGAALLAALTAGTASADRVPLPGSTAAHRLGEAFAPLAKKDEQIAVTVVLRRQNELDPEMPRMSRAQAQQTISANPSDVAAVAAFAQRCGLKISQEDLASRRLRIEGAMEQMESAFGVRLGVATDASGQQHLTYKGVIWIPKPLAGIVTAVLGFDQRPVARHSAGQA